MNELKIAERRREDEEKATEKRASILGFTYLDLRPYEDNMPLIKDVLTLDELYSLKMIPLIIGDDLHPHKFAITSSSPESGLRKIRERYAEHSQKVEYFMISIPAYKKIMLRFDPPKVVKYDDIKIASAGDSATFDKVTKTLDTVPIDDMLNFIIDQADLLGASDIHIENQRKNIRIRFRVDGALHPVAKLSREKYRVLIAAIASKSGLSTVSTKSQSGHIQKDVKKKDSDSYHSLNIRIEMVPTLYGQDVVMRLFNFDQSLLNLDLLGIPKKQRKEIEEVISHPHGMVLMVGPTGSGKSTTLYSIINALNSSDRKILTLEDPIEFNIDGISQIPVNTVKGSQFADALRSVLRLDPDVVMVGEIRDADTAKTAIQASITGHLVLSSFHANTTSTAFARMVDLIGINPIFSSAIRLVIAQRLVRRLADDTKEAYRADEATANWIREVLKDLPEGIEKPDLENITLYRPVASEEHPFGYTGRVVIIEMMVVTEEISKFLRGDVKDVNSETIENVAKNAGMVTLLQAGVLAALRGETTLEEINRVI